MWQSREGDREVTVCYNEMVTLWQELNQCYEEEWGSPTDSMQYMKSKEDDKLYLFLVGLNRELDEVWGRILG